MLDDSLDQSFSDFLIIRIPEVLVKNISKAMSGPWLRFSWVVPGKLQLLANTHMLPRKVGNTPLDQFCLSFWLHLGQAHGINIRGAWHYFFFMFDSHAAKVENCHLRPLFRHLCAKESSCCLKCKFSGSKLPRGQFRTARIEARNLLLSVPTHPHSPCASDTGTWEPQSESPLLE